MFEYSKGTQIFWEVVASDVCKLIELCDTHHDPAHPFKLYFYAINHSWHDWNGTGGG